MSSTNQGPEYLKAEKEYLNSEKMDDKVYWLEQMIKECPKHKSSENMLRELRTRLKKLREKAEVGKKRAGGKKGIRKEGFQFVLLGKTNVGKSLLLSKLTHASPKVAAYMFTTKAPEIGTFFYDGVKAQVVDAPSVGDENFDVGLVNNADCLLIVVEDLKELKELEKAMSRNEGSRLVVVNKIDKLGESGRRKLRDRIKSKRVRGLMVSAKSGDGLDDLKGMMFGETGFIRVYLKEPGKTVNKKKPLVLKAGATVRDVGEGIFKGFSKTVSEVRLTGPSGKFPNQRIGLSHKVKDRDVVEFHTR